MQVILKNGEKVTLTNSDHIPLRTLQQKINFSPEDDASIGEAPGYIKWGDIDWEATEKLHQEKQEGPGTT